ncbi:phospholipid scramblase 4-like [Mirounga leonina]|uniref:phospholipid scramblase 4-like n=1 Tax=Mirounga leonina TaxID=9715 RepID=UPI00156C1571|nr:phospholipid scramblase 4-like [Mirounga leonina]
MVYIVTEDTDDFTRNAYRTLRPFVLRVTDCMGREIMTMQRPFRCTYCCLCCPSTRQEVVIYFYLHVICATCVRYGRGSCLDREIKKPKYDLGLMAWLCPSHTKP